MLLGRLQFKRDNVYARYDDTTGWSLSRQDEARMAMLESAVDAVYRRAKRRVPEWRYSPADGERLAWLWRRLVEVVNESEQTINEKLLFKPGDLQTGEQERQY